MIFVFHLKLKRFYIFNDQMESNPKNGIYFEGNHEKLKLSLVKDKQVIYFEFNQKRKKHIKIILKVFLVTLFLWYEFPFFSNVL